MDNWSVSHRDSSALCAALVGKKNSCQTIGLLFPRLVTILIKMRQESGKFKQCRETCPDESRPYIYCREVICDFTRSPTRDDPWTSGIGRAVDKSVKKTDTCCDTRSWTTLNGVCEFVKAMYWHALSSYGWLGKWLSNQRRGKRRSHSN